MARMMARGDWNHREVLGTYYTERGCLPVTRTIDVLVTICVQTMRDPERVASPCLDCVCGEGPSYNRGVPVCT